MMDIVIEKLITTCEYRVIAYLIHNERKKQLFQQIISCYNCCECDDNVYHLFEFKYLLIVISY